MLALASKQIKQGRFSKWALTYTSSVAQCAGREVHEEVTGGKRDRNRSPKIGSINPGRGSDNCCADVRRRPWSCGKCEGGHGRCVRVTTLFSKSILSVVRLDGKEVLDIDLRGRQDIGDVGYQRKGKRLRPHPLSAPGGLPSRADLGPERRSGCLNTPKMVLAESTFTNCGCWPPPLVIVLSCNRRWAG